MARNKTFNALDDVFEDDFEVDELIIEDSKAEGSKQNEPKEQITPSPESNDKPNETKDEQEGSAQPFNISFEKKAPDAVTRTFRINTDISDILNSIVRDDEGSLKEGAKGFLSKLVNNAIIKELVELEVLSKEYLEETISYDE